MATNLKKIDVVVVGLGAAGGAAVLPLARAGLLVGSVESVGITGSSGSGIAPSAGTHHPVRAVNLKAYKPLEHQHVPEIEEALASAGAKRLSIRFVPISAPLSRGIFATSFARIDASVSEADVVALYQEIVDALNLELSPFERIRRISIVPEEFSVASGEPTPTLKVRRRIVAERWRAETDAPHPH